jgi:hypothetical protein
MEWFSGSNILQNAKEIIREVLVPIPLDDKQFSLLSSLEEMFHQELPTLPEHLSSPPVFSGVRVTLSV